MAVPSAGDETGHFPGSLGKLVNLLTRSLAPELAPYGVTPQQWSVLVTVSDAAQDPSLAAVSREMMVSKQNMTGMIARLETLGLIRRVGDPGDLRASMLQITRKGQQLIDAVAPVYQQWSEDLLSVLSDRERKAFIRAIARLTEHLNS